MQTCLRRGRAVTALAGPRRVMSRVLLSAANAIDRGGPRPFAGNLSFAATLSFAGNL
jgi:hypothetical protein